MKKLFRYGLLPEAGTGMFCTAFITMTMTLFQLMQYSPDNFNIVPLLFPLILYPFLVFTFAGVMAWYAFSLPVPDVRVYSQTAKKPPLFTPGVLVSLIVLLLVMTSIFWLLHPTLVTSAWIGVGQQVLSDLAIVVETLLLKKRQPKKN